MAKSARDDGAGPMRLSPMERKAVEALRALKAQAGFDEERDYAGLGLTLVTAPPPRPGASGFETRARDVFMAPGRYPERVRALLALTYADRLRHRLADVEKDRGRLLAQARVHDVRLGAKPGTPIH